MIFFQQQSIEPALDELLLLSDILTAETQTGLEVNDLEPESSVDSGSKSFTSKPV
jgi:hypothetical protein